MSMEKIPTVDKFTPTPQGNLEPFYMEPAQLEALRLVDLEGLSQKQAGERMGVSRRTVWRLIQGARRKTAQVFTEGRPIHVASFVSEHNVFAAMI